MTQLMREAVEALELAHAGLKWYRDSHPEDVDESDSEADEIIDAALSNLTEELRRQELLAGQWDWAKVADAASTLAEFAKTAPGRLPSHVQEAIEVAAAAQAQEASDKWAMLASTGHLSQEVADSARVIAAAAQALHTDQTALARFNECGGAEEPDPLERLRFFCSLAMNGQDWRDVEQFFDAMKALHTDQAAEGAKEDGDGR